MMNMFRRKLAGIGLFMALACGTALAADPAGVTLLGSGFTGRPFVIAGDIVAETDSLYETLRDFSDPRAPAVVGWLDHGMDCYWNEILADGDVLVGLTGPQSFGVIGFSVFDVSDFSAPQYHGTYSGMPYDSGWLRGHALSVSSQELLVTYDLAVPSSPDLTAFMLLGSHEGPRWPTAVGNTLLLIDHDASVRALDVSDPLHPVPLATPAVAGDRIDALAGGDGVLYALVAVGVGLADERLDLVTCDVSAPAAPVETDRLTLGTGAGISGRAMFRSGDLLVASSNDGQVRAFGLAAPSHPAVGWTLAHDCENFAVSLSAVLVWEDRELFVYPRTAYDVPPPAPTRRAPLPLLRTVVGEGPIQIAQYHYHSERLATVDVSDPYWPRLSAPFEVQAYGTLQYAGGIGLFGMDNTGRLFDLTDPAVPVPLGWVAGPDGRSTSKLVSRDLVVFENPYTELGLYLVDISDPSHPVTAAHLDEFALMGTDEGLLACGDQDGARLYDITDVTDPELVGELPDPGVVSRARIWRGHLYAMTTRNGLERALEAWDVTDPSAPVLVASRPMSFLATRLDRHGSRLYAQGARTFQVFDLAEPGSPAQIGGVSRHNSGSTGFAVNGNVTTITNHLLTVRNDGLSPSSTPPPAAVAGVFLAPAYPNPFNPSTSLSFATDGDLDLTVSVYDVRGRRLADLVRGRFRAGIHNVTWNGRDAAGSSAAAGVYLVRLHGPGVEAVQSVTMLK